MPPPADEAPRPATPRDDDTPARAAAPIDDPPPADPPASRAESPREEAPSLEKAPRDETPGNGRGRDDEISREDVIHQPTVEYTPFQTEEHEVPLGERDVTPPATRSIPSRRPA